MKKLLSLILAIVFCLSLAACKGDTANDNSTPDGETPDTPPEIVHKVYDLSTERDNANIKIHGRSAVTENGINCDNSASGIEFNAYIEGELKIEMNISQSSYIGESRVAESYFTLYIDGVRSSERIRAVSGDNTLTLASFTEGAVHNIKLIKQTEAHCSLCTVKSLEFTGYFDEKPADKEIYIEVIGDSITVGYGNLIKSGESNAGQPINQDATQAYSYLIAEKLNADVSLICVSGMGIAKGYRPQTADTFFKAQSYYRDVNAEFTPERIPDAVVINLGTNDATKKAEFSDLKTKTIALINLVRAKYGKDVPIVWAHGMMGEGRWMEINMILQGQFKGESSKIYHVEMPRNNEGGGGHPGLSAHESAAVKIVDLLKTKGIVK